MAKAIEMQIVEDVTERFAKYLKERASDRPLVQMVNTFKHHKPVAHVYVYVERDLPPNNVISYSALYTPLEFARGETIAKFCREARDYFNQTEYKNRKQMH